MSSQKQSQINVKTIEEVREKLYKPLLRHESILKKREHDSKSRTREEYQRDYTRILYSSAFRRLQGKMQLLNMDNSNFIRNRLTHSLEVAQIARSIANDFGYSEDVYVVEGCALAHDIGNPPFGHYGEKVLDRIIKDRVDSVDMEGFEGNAQTLRVLTTLQAKEVQFPGMNLTYRTLFGVTKYFKQYEKRDEGNNKGKYIYKADYELLNKVRSKIALKSRTLDVQIVDISDEIAYAAHDLEDTLKNRRFTIDEFIEEFPCNKDLTKKFTGEEIEQAISALKKYVTGAKKKASGNSDQFNSLFCKELGSKIIYELIRDIALNENDELCFKSKEALAYGLKKVTFACLNKSNEVNFYEKKGEIILKGLFEFFYYNEQYLPNEYKKCDLNDEIAKTRTITDYISGMMDNYAIETYGNIYGKNRFETSGFYDWSN